MTVIAEQDPLSAFTYALRAPETKRQYPRRFKVFLDFLKIDGCLQQQAVTFLQRNLAAVEQHVTNNAGEILTIRKYQSQCRVLGPWIPVASPTPEYFIYISDLKPEVRRALKEIHHSELRRLVLHQAVLRLFEAVGIEPYTGIGSKLIVKLIED